MLKISPSVTARGRDTSLAEGGEDEAPREWRVKIGLGQKKTPLQKERRKRVGYWKASEDYTTPCPGPCK